MNREEKQAAITETKQHLDEAVSVVVAEYKGLTVRKLEQLRGIARKANVTLKVIKNSIFKLAVADSKHSDISSLCTGQNLFAFSNEELNGARTVAEFAQKEPFLQIRGGFINGQILSEGDVRTLSTTPTLDQSRAILMRMLKESATKISTILTKKEDHE